MGSGAEGVQTENAERHWNAESKWHQMALPDLLDLSIQYGWYIISVFMYIWNLSINIFDFPSLKKRKDIRQLAKASSKKEIL